MPKLTTVTISLLSVPLSEAKKFKIIGITRPDAYFAPGIEAKVISCYLKSEAVDYFHIRKPDTDKHYFETLMEEITSDLHHRLTIHSHFELFDKYDFGGLHLKGNVSFQSGEKQIRLSRSCHSLSELCDSDSGLEYRFLSPIFDSISKSGYKSAFNLHSPDLPSLIRNKNVVALGGVTPSHLKNLFDLKFAGAALLGYLWSLEKDVSSTIRELIDSRKLL